MTNLYYIENNGCDDTTHGLTRMTDEEFAVFKRVIENLNKNSTCTCMPTISVYKINDSFVRPATDDDSNDAILYMDDGKYALEDYIYDYNFVDGKYVFGLKEGVERAVWNGRVLDDLQRKSSD